MNPSTVPLSTLQAQLLMYISNWKYSGKEPLPASIHLPHIACLLQSVGFNISRIDGSTSKSVTPLRDGQKGTRVVITCGHSGQRCFLEMPEEPEKCKCLNNSDESQEYFWEVTGKNNFPIESGSSVTPPISTDLSNVLANILTYLVHFIQGTSPKEDINATTSTTTTSSPNVDARRLSGFMDEVVSPSIVLTSPREETTPLRSLDATDKTPDQKIDSSLLQPSPNLSQSSPNLSTTQENGSCNLSTSTKPGNKKVIRLLNRAVNLLQTDQKNTSPKQVTFAIDKTKSVSSPNLSSKNKPENKPRSPVAAKSSGNKTPLSKPSIPKPLAAKLPVKTTPTISVKTPTTVQSKISNDPTKNSAGRARKRNNLYTHVKSTIPKPSPVGKVVKKK